MPERWETDYYSGGVFRVFAFLREVQTLGAEQWVILSVQDTGTGIAPEIIDKVFNPLFQYEASNGRNRNGAGASVRYCASAWRDDFCWRQK
ncbi:MAG: HAMP domain-containing histidine kinase [Chloroflexi bacterium]|nr:HAMP domain-containing histidine kinase [Chloroflexota bacterium]